MLAKLIFAAGAVSAATAVVAVAGCGNATRPAGAALFATACGDCHTLTGNESTHPEGGDLLRYDMTVAELVSFTRVMPMPRRLTDSQVQLVSRYVYSRQQAARARRSS
jgi:mono/diheme cytochrome c family protein